MPYDKPFKTFDEQLEILKNRGLSINDIEILLHTAIKYSVKHLKSNFLKDNCKPYLTTLWTE